MDNLGPLFESLSKAQGQMRAAFKNSANPFYKSSYADLNSVWDAIRKPLADNGLSVVQGTETIDGKMCLVSILGHSGGGMLKSVFQLMPKDMSMQGLGSAVTYARRFSLAALVGCTFSDDESDDDGEASEGRAHDEPKMSAQQVMKIADLIGEDSKLGAAILKGYGKHQLADIEARHFNAIVKNLENRKKDGRDSSQKTTEASTNSL